MQKLAELLSSGLTITTIIMSFCVVYLWYRSTKSVLAGKAPMLTENWFIIGVFFGFLSASLDNLYWLIPWTASYLDSPYANDLIQRGVFFNIPVRQGLGIFAAYCHIRSALSYHKRDDRRANRILLYAAIAGVMYSVMIAFI